VDWNILRKLNDFYVLVVPYTKQKRSKSETRLLDPYLGEADPGGLGACPQENPQIRKGTAIDIKLWFGGRNVYTL
jgi:hypothetical protein